MAANPTYYKSLDNLTKKFVSSIVPFQETSENFEAVTEYSLSNFKYHKFLSVDNHNVSRQYANLEEKLIIHSNTAKADALNKSTNEFLNIDICSSIKSKSDIHFSMLALLFKLSNDVLNPRFILLQRTVKKEEKDDFDWTSYLMDGIDVPSSGDFEPEELSDAGSDFEEGDENVDRRPSTITLRESQNQEIVSFNLLDSRMRKSDGVLNELSQEIIPPYWDKQKCQKDFKEKTQEMRSALTFGISNIQTSGVCLDESTIVREILFMLMGQSDLFVFPVINGKHTVSEEVVMSHATPQSLRSVLSSLCSFGDTVQKIQNFVFNCPEKLLTYKAFAHSLLKYFQKFRTNLLEIQKTVVDQKKTVLLTDVIELLNPRLYELNALQGLFETALDVDQSISNSDKASKLIGALYTLNIDQWYSAENETEKSSFYNELFEMWLDTIKPYINIIDRWITRGVLNDPHKEFIVEQFIKCSNSHDNEFWINAVSVKSEDVKNHHFWFAPILNDIILAGKSMEVLESTGTLFKRLKLERSCKASAELYSQLLDEIRINFSKQNLSEQKKIIQSSESTIATATKSDKLFHLNFQRLFPIKDTDKNKGDKEPLLLDIKVPIPVAITRTLFPLIRSRCEFANKLLLQVVMNECELKHHLQVIQKYHLMFWGDVMYDFSRSVFDKISFGEYWRDLSSLNGGLQDAILDSNPNADPSEVMVRLNHANLTNTTRNEFVNATDIIEIEYKVEWPINLVITPKGMMIYNTVFRYLLKVKRALYSLVNLHFKSLLFKPTVRASISDDDDYDDDELSIQEKAHRLSLLRAKMLRLVSHWHNFIMMKVIMAEKQIFMTKLENVNNLDELRNVHDHFLNRLMSLCLLETENKASKFVQGTLEKILHLSVVIHSQWRRGIYDMSSSTLQKYELQYNECSEFLSVILQHIANRGGVPLLESLAYFFVM